jgi:hypothetical protein
MQVAGKDGPLAGERDMMGGIVKLLGLSQQRP